MIFQNHVILKTTIKVLMIHDQLLGYPNLSLRNTFGNASYLRFSSNKICLVPLSSPGANSNKFSLLLTKDSLAACL